MTHLSKKVIRALCTIGATLSVSTAMAAAPDQDTFFYVEYGQWDSAREGTIGIEAPSPFPIAGDRWTTFLQAELGEWFTRKDNRRYIASTEAAIGPAWRYYLDASRDLYFQAVANLSFISPRFWRDFEQQGTNINFAGGFAFGYLFGATKCNEVSLGAEHFSNGGMKDPNPGRNFFQLRYARSF